MAESPITLFRCFVIGDDGCGKSTIVKQFTGDSFEGTPILTDGMYISTKDISLKKNRIRLQIWDITGSDRFLSRTLGFYHIYSGGIIVFDLTKRTSFEHIPGLVQELRTKANHVALLIVGNKSDLVHSRSVSIDEAQALAQALHLPYIETSATRGDYYRTTFAILALLMMNARNPRESLETDIREIKRSYIRQRPRNTPTKPHVNYYPHDLHPLDEIDNYRLVLWFMAVVIHILLVGAVIAVLVELAHFSLADLIIWASSATIEGVIFMFLIGFDILLLILIKKVYAYPRSSAPRRETERTAFKKLCSALFGISALNAGECIFIVISSFNLLRYSGALVLLIVQIALVIWLTVRLSQLKLSLANFLGRAPPA